MKKVLVIGANGALGVSVSDVLRASGYDVLQTVRAADCRISGCRCMDVLDALAVESVITEEAPDYVLNLAATFDADFRSALAVNVQGAKNVLDAVANLKKKRVWS